MSLELSLFCDESGSDALDSSYYLLALVIHDQDDSITESIALYERSLADKGLPDLAFHASPLINAKDEYKNLSPEIRKKLLSSFRVFFRHLPIKYWAFSLRTKEHGRCLQTRMPIRLSARPSSRLRLHHGVHCSEILISYRNSYRREVLWQLVYV